MAEYASDSIPSFIMLGDKSLNKKFIQHLSAFNSINPKIDTFKLNTNEGSSSNSDSSIQIAKTCFYKSDKNFQCRFICIDNSEESKENDLLVKIYKIFLNLKLDWVNGFIFFIDGSDFITPFSNVENHAKCLKFVFSIKELEKRTALCFFNFHDDYELIYSYQRRILSSIFGENFTFECLKMIKQDWNKFLDFITSSSNLKQISLDSKQSYKKILNELTDQINLSTSLIKNLNETEEKDPKYQRTSKISNSFDKKSDLEKRMNIINQNTKLDKLLQEENNLKTASSNVEQFSHSSKFCSTSNSATHENSLLIDKSQQASNFNKTADLKIENYINPSKFIVNSSGKKYVFLILGESGSGKTTFINYLANYFEGTRHFEIAIKNPNEFKIAMPIDKNWNSSIIERFIQTPTNDHRRSSYLSQTSECREYEFKLDKCDSILFIDTPGFNDTNGNVQDTKNLKKIKQICLKNKYINGIILMINGSLSRKNLNMINFIESILQLLPNKLRKDISLILTNCQSELDCNFKPDAYFQNSLKINEIYYMQNTFFKWDKNKELNNRQKKDLKDNWEQSLNEIERMIKKIVKLESNSTESIMQIQDSELNVEEMIRVILKEKFKDLFQSYFDMKCKEIAKRANNQTMISNLHEHKYETINAIPFASNPIVSTRLPANSNSNSNSTIYLRHEYNHPQMQKITVKLDDNESKFKYSEALNQNLKIANDIKELSIQEKTILYEMENLVKEIEFNAQRLRQINSRYNFATKFSADLLELNQFVERKLKEAADIKYSFFKIQESISKIFKILQ